MPAKNIVPAAARNSKLPMRPSRVRFSDSFLNKLKLPPGKREATLFEDGATGLGIRMSQSGTIYFIVQLKLPHGGRHKETLGAWGKITIEQARDAAQARAGKIAMGVDLRAERAQAEAAAKAEAEKEEVKKFTVRVMVDRWRRGWLVKKRPGYALRAFRNVERTFASLLEMPAASVTRAEVKAVMQRHREPKTTRRPGPGNRTVGGPSAVHNATVSLKAAYNWAFGEELLSENPLNGLKLPDHKSERERKLDTDEARRVYAAADRLAYPAQHFVKLLMLTGARRGEIAGLRWDEIITEDDGSKAFVLPGARTKTGVGHHIPLSKEALKVIAACAKQRIVGCPYVLTSDGHRSFANFNRAKAWLDEALASDGGAIDAWRLHDFRRTIVSTLAKKPFRYNPVILDKLLGHQPSTLTPVARIYAQEEHADLRGEALEDWAKHLARAPATVTALPRARTQPKTKLTRNRQTNLQV
jgi:integrase